jgi:succinate dehydrogenase/fumarate reductase iron-sulfur protein|tara:strand:+ start:3114 stop:4787 length:1674 start_codon:yes stop_codon:yes gene_type:complete
MKIQVNNTNISELKIGSLIEVTIQKFDPSIDSKPYFKTFSVPYTKEMRILETIDYIVEELGESIAYQWFCGVKKCGMCGILVNGHPKLGCWEPVESKMILQPLPHFKVIRDLVIDRAEYTKNLMAIEPEICRNNEYSGFPESLTNLQMNDAAKMMHCIECMICISVCPAVSKDFVGPAPLVQLARFALDPRDTGFRAKLAKKAGIQHCVGCYQCSSVCPTEIPIYQTAIEGLRDIIRKEETIRPVSLRDTLFSNFHLIAKWGYNFSSLSNWMTNNIIIKFLLEIFLKVDRRRQLPKYCAESFESWFKKRDMFQVDGPEVILFHDTFMNYIDPEIGKATTEILELLGYNVKLVEKRKCCGRPMLSAGKISQAKITAKFNVEILAQYAKRNIPIIVVEPSCLLTIREEYSKLLSGNEVKIVSSNVFSLEEFITKIVEKDKLSKLLKFTKTKRKILLHGHCHQKALIGMNPTIEFLSLPNNYEVNEIPSSCCGMAGSNGFECEHFERSIEAAEEVIFPMVREARSEVEIVATGISCRQQIEYGTDRKALHPAQIFRDAII